MSAWMLRQKTRKQQKQKCICLFLHFSMKSRESKGLYIMYMHLSLPKEHQKATVAVTYLHIYMCSFVSVKNGKRNWNRNIVVKKSENSMQKL